MPDAFPIVALAASAGGLNALTRVLGELPGDLPAAVLVLQHVQPHRPSLLAEILGRHTALAVKEAAEGECIAPGHVYVASADHHLVVNPDQTLSLTGTARVQFVRPSADVLFESLAASCGARAVAVVLSGSGHDGAAGVKAIKKRGGTVIVQDYRTSEFAGMPEAAQYTGVADFVLALPDIAPKLRTLCASRAAQP